jgi:hypothetical protein
LAEDLAPDQGTFSLRAPGVGSLSKVLFLSTKGLLLASKAFWLESKAFWLESKVLFVEQEHILRNRTVHSRTTKRSEAKNFAPSFYSSAKGAISFDGG